MNYTAAYILTFGLAAALLSLVFFEVFVHTRD